jgi:hypothetical protein
MAAQNSQPVSPFVSELTAEARNNLVRLSWRDSVDAQGPVYIFRSSRPFTGSVPLNIRPLEVAYGTQSYIDEIDGNDAWYYFIAASDRSGQRHDIVVPNTNTIRVSAARETVPRTRIPPAEPLPGPGIFGLAARVEDDKIIISFNTDRAEGSPRNGVLYRSLYPIRQPGDLLNAVIVQSGVSSPFTDSPLPGLPWYYALVSEDEIRGGRAGIYPGRNATTEAASIAGEEAPAAITQQIRSMPLPAMSLYNAVPWSDHLSELTVTIPLSEEAAQAVDATRVDIAVPPPPEKKPRVFARDLAEPSGGEESALMRIVQGSFTEQDWRTAHDELQRYLSLPRSADAERRARFYLGQTCYFSGKYREALVEFLSAQSLHPHETHVWIEATLEALVR